MPAPNGLRYPRVGGVWIRSESRKNSKPGKCSKIAQTPTRRVHAVLGALIEHKTPSLEEDTTADLTKLLHTIHTLPTDKKHDRFEMSFLWGDDWNP